MITHVLGTLVEKRPPQLVVDVNGMGYEIDAPMTTFYALPDAGAPVKLFTHLVVREDAHILYGFSSQDERSLFRALIRVNGVGPKVALAILSGMDVPHFVRCITTHDAGALTKIPGIGRKTAERLVVEMQDRLPDALPTALNARPESVPPTGGGVNIQQTVAEAESALVSLGYKPQEAARMIATVDTAGLRSEDVIRQALRNTVRT